MSHYIHFSIGFGSHNLLHNLTYIFFRKIFMEFELCPFQFDHPVKALRRD